MGVISVRVRCVVFLFALAIVPSAGLAQVFGTVRVSAHDAQGLALADADVVVKAEASSWTQTRRRMRRARDCSSPCRSVTTR